MGITRDNNLVRIYTFSPLQHTEYAQEQEDLRALLETEVGVPAFPGMRARRQREYWALELPLGIFYGNLRPGVVTHAQELEARHAFFRYIATQQDGLLGFNPTRDILTDGGVDYYRSAALAIFRVYAASRSALFNAFYHFSIAAQASPELITGPKKRTGKPLEERPLIEGWRARGPSWSPEEDQVLRKWLGKWVVDGKHHKLTDGMWDRLLHVDLAGLRTRSSVLKRCSVLNALTKEKYSVNGTFPRHNIKAYKAECVGEQIRAPSLATVVRGTHHLQAVRRPDEGSEETISRLVHERESLITFMQKIGAPLQDAFDKRWIYGNIVKALEHAWDARNASVVSHAPTPPPAPASTSSNETSACHLASPTVGPVRIVSS